MKGDGPLRLLSELLASTADAHSPRVIVRAIATTLARWVSIVRVELQSPAPDAIAVLSQGEWQCIESEPASPSARSIATGLAVVATSALPEFFGDAEFRETLGQVVAAATRHLDVIKRVAHVSRRAHMENRELRADLDRLGDHGEIVARSPAMRAALTRAKLVARHPTTVLLSGESGTGKDVLAREIHRLSPRSHRPMIELNCGAIPETLVESELFGHDRGAFTGADRVHVGAFERAHRGTLFLDEIGELPLAAQAKLLRVLQERRIRRVGGEGEIEVDIRLIAATNRRLSALVDNGAFREDLFYRLDVFTIQLPPLRERRGDLGPLVAALTRELAQRLELPVPSISRSLLARLEDHDWPGNVRELMNSLETAMILGGGDGLELPEEFSRRTKRDGASAAPRFESAVRVAIEEALRATRGKIYGSGGAAARLGLKPGTLQSKMRKLGIERRHFV
ncbi:MAG TPA: sigma 54-interacting transcriptional regulator [Kofleriaceae bacterium]|nr:sigma 54-interacting transcriptional regulator [Kofleriaceae bacterium]